MLAEPLPSGREPGVVCVSSLPWRVAGDVIQWTTYESQIRAPDANMPSVPVGIIRATLSSHDPDAENNPGRPRRDALRRPCSGTIQPACPLRLLDRQHHAGARTVRARAAARAMERRRELD